MIRIMGFGQVLDSLNFKRMDGLREKNSVSRQLCFNYCFWMQLSANLDNDYKDE